jgi:hypothetical protein
MTKKLAVMMMTGFAAFVAGVIPASAATVGVDVPFAFQAGKAKLAAGTYRLTYSTYGGPVTVWNRDENRTVLVATQPTGNPNLPKKPGLVFARHADGTYRLYEIHVSGAQSLAVPGGEKPALVAGKPDVTFVEVAMGQ